MSVLGGRSGETFHADRDQAAAIEGEAMRRGVTLDLLPPELDVSGGVALEKRPSLLRAVEGVERGEYAGIMVAYLSRLGRSVREQLKVWDRVEAAGGRIIVVQEGIDTTTPAGRFQRTVMLAVAEMELDTHRDRFENLREWATAAGIWQRRQTPRGYRRDETTRKLVPDDDAELVREMFRGRASDILLVEAADKLRMTPSGARQLFRNRVYLGELKVGKHLNPAAHPPLITPAEWEAAQSEHHLRPPRGRNKDPALLSKIIRCAGCGHAMTRSGGGTSGTRKAPFVYCCVVRHSEARCQNPANITAHIIDRYVTDVALYAMRSIAAVSNPDVAVDAAAAAALAADNEMAVFLRRVTSVGLDEREYLAALQERRETARTARESLALAQSSRLPALRVSPHEVWDDLTVRQQNRVLRGLLEVVVVSRAGRGGRTIPAEQRARVVARGAGLRLPVARGGAASGLVPLDLDEIGDPYLLRLPLGHDLGEGAGG